jgi:signal transduction histidine kinase
MSTLFGVGAALLMMTSTSLLSWNTRREAENIARNSLASVSLSLREPLRQNANLSQIKQVLTQHNAQVGQNSAWAAEVEAWLLSPGGKVLWETGPYRPPMRSSSGANRTGNGAANNNSISNQQGRFVGEDQTGTRFDFGPPNGQDWPDGRPRQRPFWMRFRVPPRENAGSWRRLELKRGKDTLILGVPFFRNSRTLRSQMLSLLFLGLFSSGAAAVGAWFLVGKVLSPIEKLAVQANGLTQNDSFEGRLSATSSDFEMRHLTATLNEMLAVMGESTRSKERFHTAASHELRTPLQALSGHLQVALSRVRNADDYRLALEEAARQTDRLSSLTRDLLILNQLQMATSKPPREWVDATEVLTQTIDRFAPDLEARRITMREDLRPCEVETAPSHLEMLVRNLIENAVKYAVDGGQIEFVIGESELIIWNETGELLDDSDLVRLFEPFFRPDVSRHSSTGGNGLGLSICRALCDANDWSIALQGENRGEKLGVCALVRFSPLATEIEAT